MNMENEGQAIQDIGVTSAEADGSMVAVVKDCLEELGWSYEISEKGSDRTLITTRVQVDHATCRTHFDISEPRQRFGIFVFAPFAVPEGKRSAVMAYLTRANYRLYLAKFEMDMTDGELRTACTVMPEESHLSLEMVRRMRRGAHGAMEIYLPGILSILYGDCTADEAWQALLDREAEEASFGANDTSAGQEEESATA